MDANAGRISDAWAMWALVAFGVWLVLAPFGLFYVTAVALWNNIIAGVLVAAMGYWGTRSTSTTPRWLAVVLGYWLVFSPFLLDYETTRAAANDLIMGSIIGFLGLMTAARRLQRRLPGGRTLPPQAPGRGA